MGKLVRIGIHSNNESSSVCSSGTFPDGRGNDRGGAGISYSADHKLQERHRVVARTLVLRAADILSELGGTDARVSWLLEDCASLMRS